MTEVYDESCKIRWLKTEVYPSRGMMVIQEDERIWFFENQGAMCSAWPLWCSNLPHAALFRYWLFLYRDDCHSGHKPPWEQVLFVKEISMKLQWGKLKRGKLRRRTLYGTRTWSSDLDLGHWRPILDTGPWAGTWEPGPGNQNLLFPVPHQAWWHKKDSGGLWPFERVDS